MTRFVLLMARNVLLVLVLVLVLVSVHWRRRDTAWRRAIMARAV